MAHTTMPFAFLKLPQELQDIVLIEYILDEGASYTLDAAWPGDTGYDNEAVTIGCHQEQAVVRHLPSRLHNVCKHIRASYQPIRKKLLEKGCLWVRLHVLAAPTRDLWHAYALRLPLLRTVRHCTLIWDMVAWRPRHRERHSRGWSLARSDKPNPVTDVRFFASHAVRVERLHLDIKRVSSDEEQTASFVVGEGCGMIERLKALQVLRGDTQVAAYFHHLKQFVGLVNGRCEEAKRRVTGQDSKEKWDQVV